MNILPELETTAKNSPKHLPMTPALSAPLERLPFEIFEQIITPLPEIWQTSLLVSSPILWRLHKIRFLTTITHRAALRELTSKDPPDQVFCFECAQLRPCKTDGHGSECPHSCGRRPGGGGKLEIAHPRTLPNEKRIHQSIVIDFDDRRFLNFLTYRQILRKVCLRPDSGSRETFEFECGHEQRTGKCSFDRDHWDPCVKDKIEYLSFKGGLCSKSTHLMALYPLDMKIAEAGLGFIRVGQHPFHRCTAPDEERVSPQGVSFPSITRVMRYVLEMVNTYVNQGKNRSTYNRTYRCRKCVSEISISLSPPGYRWKANPEQEYDNFPFFTDSSKSGRITGIAGMDFESPYHFLANPACIVINIDEYKWLGAALFPHHLPHNQPGTRAGLSDEEFEAFVCMKDGLKGTESRRLHLDLPEMVHDVDETHTDFMTFFPFIRQQLTSTGGHGDSKGVSMSLDLYSEWQVSRWNAQESEQFLG